MEQRETLSEHVVAAVSGVSRHRAMLWTKQPLVWRFDVSVGDVAGDQQESFHQALQAALMEWMSEKDQGSLSMPEKPKTGLLAFPFFSSSGGNNEDSTAERIFPFEMRHDNPTDSLVNLRFDAMSLMCLNNDTGLCRNGKALFQEVLARTCAKQEVTARSCGELTDLRVHLIVPEKLVFAVSLAPLPQSLVDDVGRFQQSTMEEWAIRASPFFQTVVAQTCDVAEDLVKVRNVRIENQPPEQGKTTAVGLVFEVELGLLAPTSKTPVRDVMLAKMPWDHEWVVDTLGIASEEEHVGDIVVSVADITT